MDEVLTKQKEIDETLNNIRAHVFYFCNGKNPACGHCAGCYIHGGQCNQTTNRRYAITPECKDPWNYPERFEVVTYPGLPSYYFEKEPGTDGSADVQESESNPEELD